ncbi:MAG: hypothetical protein AAGB34_04850, partial [Planctomycetota bacterium]
AEAKPATSVIAAADEMVFSIMDSSKEHLSEVAGIHTSDRCNSLHRAQPHARLNIQPNRILPTFNEIVLQTRR